MIKKVVQIKKEDGLIQVLFEKDPFWLLVPPSDFSRVAGSLRHTSSKEVEKTLKKSFQGAIVTLYSKTRIRESDVSFRLEDIENKPFWSDSSTGLKTALAEVGSWLAGESDISLPAEVLTNLSDGYDDFDTITVTGPATGVLPECTSFSVLFEGTIGSTFNGKPAKIGIPLEAQSSVFRSFQGIPYTVVLGATMTVDIVFKV